MITKNITVTIGETDFDFNVTSAEYNNYVNRMKPDDKIAPTINFLRGALVNKKDQQPALDELIDGGLALDIAAVLIEDFRPKMEIMVKKSQRVSAN